MAPQADRSGLPWVRAESPYSPDPESQKKEEQRQKSAAILRRLYGDDDSKGGARKSELVLNQYEQAIAAELVDPKDIPVRWDDIAGLDDIIKDLKQSVIWPLMYPKLFAANPATLRSAPSGVILEGPPGCGKTMIAKALAAESGASFINLNISTLTDKWYGESNRLVRAVFTLARKVQPCIIFIDEIDALLAKRSERDHEASGMVKAEFMTHWDGLQSESATEGRQRIVVFGATNRSDAIDKAFIRRLGGKPIEVRPPDARGRAILFKKLLKNDFVDWEDLDLEEEKEDLMKMDISELLQKPLIRRTEGWTGSDIKDACVRAVNTTTPYEAIEAMLSTGKDLNQVVSEEVLDPVRLSNFFKDVETKSIPVKPVVAPVKIVTEEREDWLTESESASTDTHSMRPESPE
ncbi:Membrane-spanning ATPase [Penicillium verhagenii]|nr:Membrane-spanning ATPase [Penicillium verhagenii]